MTCQLLQLWDVVSRATWRTLKADMVVGTDAAVGLFFVDAPEALLQAGVDDFPGVCRCHPICSTSLHGHGPSTNSLPVIEADRFQAFIVSIPSRMVDVEPRSPLSHAWRHMEQKCEQKQGSRITRETCQKERKQFNSGSRNKGGGLNQQGWVKNFKRRSATAI